MSNQEAIASALEACKMWRDKGNQAYRDGRLQEADDCYTKGIDCVPSEECSESCKCELMLCFSDRVAARKSLGRTREADDDCHKALEIHVGFIKDRLRTADRLLALGEAEKSSIQSDGVDSKTLVEAREDLGKAELQLAQPMWCLGTCWYRKGCLSVKSEVKTPNLVPLNILSNELNSANHGGTANVPLSDAVLPPPRWDNGVKVVPSMDAVVKVFCTHTEPNFSLPWQMKRPYSSNSSGVVISGRRVLTNAHSVEHYTQVKVKKRSSDTKYLATILAIGTECDIAMLTVNDDEFWEDVEPVEFGSLPALQDAVTVVGYPIGGDTISVTSGVVSRIEILSYSHGSTELIGLQVDAAINNGNSGGPAFNNKGQCVGIAFQYLKEEGVENIGYVIPTPVIMHFITDYEKSGQYTGIEWQKMENPDLRKAMGMKPDQKGIRVRRVEPTALESCCLKPSDIILSFDGVDIANDGTVPFRQGERIGFSYLVSQKYTGQKAVIKVLRDFQVVEFSTNLSIHKRLMPPHINGRPPSYYIVAGFVFTYVTIPYLQSEYPNVMDTPIKLLEKQLHAMAQSEDEQLVVVSQVLVADINIGYEDIVNTQVISFNGKPVKNLKSLVQMVEECNDEFLKFDLEYEQIVVLETKSAKAATHDIVMKNCIASAMSDDLKDEIY